MHFWRDVAVNETSVAFECAAGNTGGNGWLSAGSGGEKKTGEERFRERWSFFYLKQFWFQMIYLYLSNIIYYIYIYPFGFEWYACYIYTLILMMEPMKPSSHPAKVHHFGTGPFVGQHRDLEPCPMGLPGQGYPGFDTHQWCLRYVGNLIFLWWKWTPGWWFQRFFYVHPYLGKMNPFWRAYFSDGLKPPTRHSVQNSSCHGYIILV